MDMFPLFNKKLPIPVGVEIRYEKFDAEHLMHMLCFLQHFTERSKGKFHLVPEIIANGHKTSVAKLIKSFGKFAEGERQINGYVSVYFLDEMRPLFEEYHALLRKIKDAAESEFDWDDEHQFFPLINYFNGIEATFFPKKAHMQ